MSVKIIAKNQKVIFDKISPHPLQSWAWGDFRKKTGVKVIRLGRDKKNKLVETAQITIHPLPFSAYTIGYYPRGGIISKSMLNKIYEIGLENNCIFVKIYILKI